MPSADLGVRGNTGVVFRNGTMDFHADTLLGHAQQGGLSPGALLEAFRHIRDGDPDSWVRTFTELARLLEAAASTAEDWSAVQVAHRARLMLQDPRTPAAAGATASMADAFRRFLALGGVPLEHRPIPFGGQTLPAYTSTGIETAERFVLVLGGGDTYVEDLWFFGGRALVEAGWPIVLVDLPGQGSTPGRGLFFGESTLAGLTAVLDELHARGVRGEAVLLGWSGGGIFVTKYASIARPEDRIAAVVASTPVHDVVAMFERSFPAVLRREPESWPVRTLLALLRRHRVLARSLAQYDWQFGPRGLVGVLNAVGALGRTDLSALDVPVLALVGAGESEHSARQASDVVGAVRPRHPSARVIRYPAWTGAAAHCQVGNLPLALRDVVAWLDAVGSRST